jgi:hypothetical protein
VRFEENDQPEGQRPSRGPALTLLIGSVSRLQRPGLTAELGGEGQQQDVRPLRLRVDYERIVRELRVAVEAHREGQC